MLPGHGKVPDKEVDIGIGYSIPYRYHLSIVNSRDFFMIYTNANALLY